MNLELKRVLLQRMFTDLDYMERFTRYYVAAMDIALDAFAEHEKTGPHSWAADRWRSIVKPNYEGMRAGAIESLRHAKENDLEWMSDCCGDLNSLSRNLDHAGRDSFDWWTDMETQCSYGYCLNNAQRMGSNLYWALDHSWKTPESILKESVTGPINERELYRYLTDEEKITYAFDPLNTTANTSVVYKGTMPRALKEVLLKRKFSSIDYINRYCAYFEDVCQIPLNEFILFKKRADQDLSMQATYEISLRMWPNEEGTFRGLPAGAWLAFHAYREGYTEWMIDFSLSCNELYFEPESTEKRHAWWPRESESRKLFSHARDQLKRDGLNIYKTLRNVWHPGEIFDESITGPIDDSELLEHMKIGDSAKYNFYMQGTHPDDE